MYLSGDFSAIRIKGLLTFEIEKFANTERIALKHVLDNGNYEEFSFKYLNQKSNQLANVLDSVSLKDDDRVGIILGQCPETILSHMACFKSGKISIPLFSLFGDDALLF